MATTGEINATSGAQYGSTGYTWTNPGNAAGASSTSYAQAGIDPGTTSDVLTLLFQFPSFPVAAIEPLGYIARVRRRQNGGGTVYTHGLYLSLNSGSTTGDNKADSLVNWTTAAGYEITEFGGAADLWGNTFTLAQLVTGVYLHLAISGGTAFELGGIARVEHASLEAYYSEAASTIQGIMHRRRRSVIAYATNIDTEPEAPIKNLVGL